MNDSEIYARIGDELSRAEVDVVLWTRAMSVADGNEAATRAAYARLRYEALRAANDVEAIARLAAAGKPTLYAALNVPPGASQDEILRACEGLRARMRFGKDVGDPVTLRYAIETLQDPRTRRRYDRSLLRGMERPAPDTTPLTPEFPFRGAANRLLAGWNSPRMLALLVAGGVAAATATVFLHRHEAARLDLERARVATEQARVEHGAANAAARALNEAVAAQEANANQAAALRDAARLQDRRIGIAERTEYRRERELDNRAAAAREALDQSRRLVNEQLAQLAWQRQQVQQERSRRMAEQDTERDRTQLIGIYLGRNQFLLARDVARTPSDLAEIAQAEAADRQRAAAAEAMDRQHAAFARAEERRHEAAAEALERQRAAAAGAREHRREAAARGRRHAL